MFVGVTNVLFVDRAMLDGDSPQQSPSLNFSINIKANHPLLGPTLSSLSEYPLLESPFFLLTPSGGKCCCFQIKLNNPMSNNPQQEKLLVRDFGQLQTVQPKDQLTSFLTNVKGKDIFARYAPALTYLNQN